MLSYDDLSPLHVYRDKYGMPCAKTEVGLLVFCITGNHYLGRVTTPKPEDREPFTKCESVAFALIPSGMTHPTGG